MLDTSNEYTQKVYAAISWLLKLCHQGKMIKAKTNDKDFTALPSKAKKRDSHKAMVDIKLHVYTNEKY